MNLALLRLSARRAAPTVALLGVAAIPSSQPQVSLAELRSSRCLRGSRR